MPAKAVDNIERQLEEIVSNILEISKDKLRSNKNSNFFKDLGTDSLLGLEIIAAVERKFDIKIADEEVNTLETFNAILSLVKSRCRTYRQLKKS